MSKEYLLNQWIDFYTYQSGHMLDNRQHFLSPTTMASQLWVQEPKLPIMNLEPMYEAHDYGNRFGRFDEKDVRRAF